jgi:hypothetical protein
MNIDERTVIELVRSKLPNLPATDNLRIIWQIPPALDRLARKVAADPSRRPLLLSNFNNTVIPIVNGEVDIANYNTDPSKQRLLVQFIRYGNAWYEGVDVNTDEDRVTQYPLQWMDPSEFISGAVMAQTDHVFAGDYLFYWLDGTTLRILDWEPGSPLNGFVRLSVPYVPTLEDLTNIDELHADLIEKVIELLTGYDAAEDDAK